MRQQAIAPTSSPAEGSWCGNVLRAGVNGYKNEAGNEPADRWEAMASGSRKFFNWTVVLTTCIVICAAGTIRAQTERWSDDKAKTWFEQQGWLVGSNYIPEDAINELEMWQAQSFNAAQIDKELGWAEDIGMNTMRVFLHDLLWQEDPEGFKKRMDQFLEIASRHHIRPLFVLFDSCWDPSPKLGVQHPPIPGVHNSGWVQSPGSAALTEPAQEGRLKAYVGGGVG